MEKRDFYGYFTVKKPTKGEMPSFALGGLDYVKEAAQRWKNRAEGIVDESDGKKVPDDKAPDFTHASALTDALSASVDFGLSQHELVEAASIAPIIIEMGMANREVINPSIADATVISEDDNATIYGLNEGQFTDLIKRQERFSAARKGLERFPSATLLSIVATFDTLIVDILSKLLKLQPDWLEKSDRTISLGKLSRASCIEDLINEQIAEEVYHFSRGSHSEQSQYIKKNFGIDIQKYWKRWPDYIEIFERRNLVAHGESLFNKRYVEICSREGHKGSEKILGEKVKLSRSYLRQSLDVLIEFSVLLSFSLFRKFVKDTEEAAFTNLNEAVFKLIQNGRYSLSDRLCDYALSLEKTKITNETKLMLLVNRASAIRHGGNDDEARKLLEGTDWSAVSDIFKICVASVKGDVDEFARLCPILKASGTLEGGDILSWPCFSFMVIDEKGQKAISDAFGVEVTKKIESKGAKDDTDRSEDGNDHGQSEGDENTLH